MTHGVWRRIIVGLLLGAWPTALVACSSVSGAPDEKPAEHPSLRLFTFWESPGERDALNGLIADFQTENPEVPVKTTVIDGGLQEFQRVFGLRSEHGNYPDIFQANSGYGLFEWVLLDGSTTANSIISPLPAEALPWDALHAEVLRTVSFEESFTARSDCGGAPPCTHKLRFALPLGIHRNNSLFFNRQFFRDFELKAPSSWHELIGLCTSLLEQTGHPPLSLGMKQEWPLHLLFESVLLTSAGPEFYRDFWRGRTTLKDASTRLIIESALDRLLTLRSCLNVDAAELDWAQGVERLLASPDDNRFAAMAVMGDWAKGLLSSQGYLVDEDFGVMAFPGTQDVFVMTVDMFAIPLGSHEPKLSLRFLKRMAEPEVARRFALAKGAIPARADVNMKGFDSFARESYCALESSRRNSRSTGCAEDAPSAEVVYAIALLLPNRAVAALDAALFSMFKDGEKETVRLMLRNYAPLFRSSARTIGW